MYSSVSLVMQLATAIIVLQHSTPCSHGAWKWFQQPESEILLTPKVMFSLHINWPYATSNIVLCLHLCLHLKENCVCQ